MSYRFLEDGHISSPRGFRATGVSCGLKEARARDLAAMARAGFDYELARKVIDAPSVESLDDA
jgi:hypothetical protein